MTRSDVEKILLQGGSLAGANLRDIDLSGVDLSNINMEGVKLRAANLRGANLTGANLNYADLRGATLNDANLRGANLRGADLSYAILQDANLSDANLTGADLSCAILFLADLSDTDLTNAKGTLMEYRKGKVLTEALIGYKKCQDGVIVTLEIPKGATVFSINGKKCRTNKVKVLAVDGADRAVSYRNHLTYYVGNIITINDFDLRYNVDCTTGIHFFMNREDAENYMYI